MNPQAIIPSASATLLNGMSVRFCSIPPEVCARLLDECNTNNRKRRDDVRDTYVRDMASGNWSWSDSAVCFSPRGILLNGQHRLSAAVKAGVVLNTLVIFNMPESCQVYMDQSFNRRLADILMLAGEEGVTTHTGTIINAMQIPGAMSKKRLGKMTTSEAQTFLRKHADAVAFVSSLGMVGKRFFGSAGVLGALGRAYYHVNTEDLRRFCHLLTAEEPTFQPGEQAVALLRSHLLASAGRGSGMTTRTDLYMKTTRCIQLFLSKSNATRLHAAPECPWPLPE